MTAATGQTGGAQRSLQCLGLGNTKALVTLQVSEVMVLERGPQEVWPLPSVTGWEAVTYVVPMEGRSP